MLAALMIMMVGTIILPLLIALERWIREKYKIPSEAEEKKLAKLQYDIEQLELHKALLERNLKEKSIKCKLCGAVVSKESKFCPYCGSAC